MNKVLIKRSDKKKKVFFIYVFLSSNMTFSFYIYIFLRNRKSSIRRSPLTKYPVQNKNVNFVIPKILKNNNISSAYNRIFKENGDNNFDFYGPFQYFLIRVSICRASALSTLHIHEALCYQRPSRSLSQEESKRSGIYVFAVTPEARSIDHRQGLATTRWPGDRRRQWGSALTWSYTCIATNACP